MIKSRGCAGTVRRGVITPAHDVTRLTWPLADVPVMFLGQLHGIGQQSAPNISEPRWNSPSTVIAEAVPRSAQSHCVHDCGIMQSASIRGKPQDKVGLEFPC